MVITTSIETLDELWLYCYRDCILGRAPRTKETLPDFCENVDLNIWDTIVRYRVTQNLRKFSQVDGLSIGLPGFKASHYKFDNITTRIYTPPVHHNLISLSFNCPHTTRR